MDAAVHRSAMLDHVLRVLASPAGKGEKVIYRHELEESPLLVIDQSGRGAEPGGPHPVLYQDRFYPELEGNTGVDLRAQEAVPYQPSQRAVFLSFGRMRLIARTNSATYDNRMSGYGYAPFDVRPRSGLVKTGFRAANVPGLVDPSYTGDVKCALDVLPDTRSGAIPTGTAYFQAVDMRGALMQVLVLLPGCERSARIAELVFDAAATGRGANGFGSTGLGGLGAPAAAESAPEPVAKASRPLAETK